MVLSHCQHQHPIKPKDKHGPWSTVELISSPGCISQLLSICPNTNLLFFTEKKRTLKQCSLRKQLFRRLWISTTMTSPQCYYLCSEESFLVSWHDVFCFILKEKKVARERHGSMKRKEEVWETSSLPQSVFQHLWLCGSENKKNLYVGLEFKTVHEQQVFHVIPNTGKRFKWWIYNLDKRKAGLERENMRGRTAANWNSITVKTCICVVEIR